MITEAQGITVSVSERDGWSVVEVAGEIDLLTSPTLRRHLVELTVADHHDIVLDLSGVTFFDSSGLSAIVGGLKLVRNQHGQLRIAGAVRRVAKVFEIAGLSRMLALYESVEAALAGDEPAAT